MLFYEDCPIIIYLKKYTSNGDDQSLLLSGAIRAVWYDQCDCGDLLTYPRRRGSGAGYWDDCDCFPLSVNHGEKERGVHEHVCALLVVYVSVCMCVCVCVRVCVCVCV